MKEQKKTGALCQLCCWWEHSGMANKNAPEGIRVVRRLGQRRHGVRLWAWRHARGECRRRRPGGSPSRVRELSGYAGRAGNWRVYVRPRRASVCGVMESR
jgi:hypothetical protein